VGPPRTVRTTAQIAVEAEQIARTITDPAHQARALTALAKAIAETNPAHAEQIAAEVTVISQSWTTVLPFLPSGAAIAVAEELTSEFGHAGR
jgi:hypothetical protein